MAKHPLKLKKQKTDIVPARVKTAMLNIPRRCHEDPKPLIGTYNVLGYHSVRVANLEGRVYTRASGEAHERFYRYQLVNQSREFFRNNAIYRGMIDRATNYIVGNGFTLQAKTGDADLNSVIEKAWRQNWRRPEIRNILSGRKCERMVCRELLTVGDVGILKLKPRKILLFEGEQITRGSWIDDGLDKDKYGKITKVYAGGYTKYGLIDRRTIKEFSPDEFLLLVEPERPSSYRGVPPCQAAFPMLHRINDVCDSEAIAWQLLARIAVSVTRESGKQLAYLESRTAPDKLQEEPELTTRIAELGYALIFHGSPGDKIQGIERNLPGRNFADSMTMFLRLLGLPLGLPLEVVLLDWTKSNYSQSRAVLEQAFQSFLGWQFELSEFFLNPIFTWWNLGMIESGEAKKLHKDWTTDNEHILDHDWIRPTFPWIDQLKEFEAAAGKVDRCFNTHQAICKSLGRERDDVVNDRDEEIRDAIDKAHKIKKDTGEDVPWQLFCGLEPPSDKQKPIKAQIAPE
jgi:capsid protein